MATTDKLVEQLGGMTVLDLVELKKKLEEEWGVTAAAPVAVAAGVPADRESADEAEEKTEFDAILESVGDKKIQVIKVVRTITGLGLKEAKALVDGAPGPVKEAVGKDEAESIKSQIEEVGGSVEVR